MLINNMADPKIVGGRRTPDSKARHAVSKRSHNSKTIHFRQVKGLKQSQSPKYRKDYETPKRRPRAPRNVVSHGESPSDVVQDIIWDPASPTAVRNGTESAKPSHYKSVEISDIVNRIAPKDKRPDSLESPLLEWILGGSIPCTPEVWPPRVKRISTRQSNVEDLVKLAKQFDYNMIQQEKERDIVTSDQCPGTSLHCPPSPNDCLNGGIPKNQVEPKGPSSAVQDIDEELNALFDGPTQHLNRRLSQISANSSQESKNNPECLREDCASLDAIKGTSAPCSRVSHAHNQIGNLNSSATDPNFDDDWENDDLLNDSFVLEMTQNPDILSVPPQATAGPVSQNSKASELVIKTSPPVSVQIPACAQRGQNNSRHTSLHTKETSTNRSTFMLDSKTQFQSKNTRSREPPKLNQKADGAKLHEQRHILPPHRPQATSANRSKQSTGGVAKSVKSIPDGEEKSLFGSDPLWGDEDDDLLYQVCDDMERISGSQEQCKDVGHGTKYIDIIKPNYTHPERQSIMDSMGGQNHSFKTGSWPPAKTSCQRPAACVLTRSHSMPEGKAVLSNENDYSNMPVDTVQKKSLHYDPGVECQYKFTKLSNSQRPGMRTCGTLHAFPQTGARASVAGNPTNLHPSTFKRHLSDPTALGNKVFVTNMLPVKCSAAEIEKKKQDAIARRRLRMQASQKPGAPS
ncbi:ewing's tumor-associated antigen 1 [Denticeps clupeoides]|uniref:Uncharacterized protein n=1 Tax=Denticeps clupeoides TaxID=299321 RepID=A0AAY4DF95_9TELE|nr:ewing's tumor-associated antigen 1 [Denticeps clupeoides]